MKRRAVIWADNAMDDLIKIAEYIAADNPPAARKVAKAIRLAGEKLGHFSTGRRGRVRGTYEKPMSRLPYIIVYEILGAMGEHLLVQHIIHMSRDWDEDAWPQDD